LAEGSSIYPRCLPSDEELSEARRIRFDKATAESQFFGANIAEGCGRTGDAELCRFLQIAMGSASETENHLLLARDLGLITEANHDRFAGQIAEIKRMLATFIQRLRIKS
jgi:hypothetical protein